MARKPKSSIPSVGGMLRFVSALPTGATALNLAAKAYSVSQREVINLIGGKLSTLRENSDALKLVKDLAGQISLENATRRTQALTRGSLKAINDLADKLGLPREAIVATVLGLVGADLESVFQRRRSKVVDGLKVVEDLRAKAESAERELVALLGAEHPISWDLLTSGIAKVHGELRAELHALAQSAGAKVVPTASEPEKPPAKRKAAPKRKAKAKARATKKKSKTT